MAALEHAMQTLVEFMRVNQEWAIPIVFLVAFCECVAILSWLVPATVFFTTFGAVAGASGLNLVPLALAASLGAGSGFWVSYWAGLILGPRVHDYWPFTKNPQLLDRGHGFFEKWGLASILIGHFFGPLRAVIAIVAGLVAMPAWQFHLANWLASFAWGFGLLYGAGRLAEFVTKGS
ncbi:DedA family protein [Bosea sp. (in: a-proteobacteria)]|uniref:DedA family protein n=1 Tax=Bosea sp. (in: a-proteobacteria) TaxID=1871050 RepID=UPI001ACEBBC8|nr:DedA family protein [Bosea sp. (in: a-proteobacteria)]MBN9443083.1 DedA family protein [Bosea sp. (in: a-proteobacteria)]